MAISDVSRGKGATFTYNAGSVTKVRSVAWSGYTWDQEDITTVEQSDDIKRKMKTLCDAGEITLTLQYNPTLYSTLFALSESFADDSTAKAWVLAFPQSGTGTQYSGNGRIIRIGGPTNEPGNIMEHELVISVDGAVTHTTGS